MRPNDTALLTRIKTRELARQHDELVRHLGRLRDEGTPTEAPSARFERLRLGLVAAAGLSGGLRFEEASYAEGLAEEIACGTASDEAVRAGVARLERELDCGARRAGAALLYGRLFDEEAPPSDDAREEAAQNAAAELRARWQAPPPPLDQARLHALFREIAASAENASSIEGTSPVGGAPSSESAASVEDDRRAKSIFSAPVSVDEVRGHLAVLGRSFDHRAELRRYAKSVEGDARALAELAGAITILLRDLDRWQWADWPTPVGVRWNRTRYRAFLEFDLVPLLVLEALALRLGIWARTSWLPLSEVPLGPQERRSSIDTQRATLRAKLVLPGVPEALSGFRGGPEGGYAGSGSITGEADHFQSLFAWLNAELWWRTASRPDAPVFVAQADIADFFPSLPHATIEALLDAMRVPSPVASFVARYLRGPFSFEGAPCTPERGLFPGHSLARVLADSLLIALDGRVALRSGLHTLRFMDDMYWVSYEPGAIDAAWAAVSEFCAETGLALNLEKSAVCRLEPRAAAPVPSETGASVAALPSGPPAKSVRWSFLELDERGEWHPSEGAVEEFVTSLRARLEAPAATRETAREYISAMGYFVRGLAPLAPLNPAHVTRLRAPLGRVHGSLFGPGRGVVAFLRERLAARHPDLAGFITNLPDAWFYWPVTAGGLGLYNPASFLAGAARAMIAWKTPQTPPLPTPDNAYLGGPESPAWAGVFAFRSIPMRRALAPTPSPAMEGRQRDFIARGGEVQGGTQKGLHAYWQWLLETHGPPLLEFFGTFRFLSTEVVPVQQIDASPAALVEQSESDDDDIPF